MKHVDPTELALADVPVTTALIEARERLVKHGWCKGVMCDDKGQHCAVGALRNWEIAPLALRYLASAALLTYPGLSVTTINDLPTTTFQQILDLYDLAIRHARRDCV